TRRGRGSPWRGGGRRSRRRSAARPSPAGRGCAPRRRWSTRPRGRRRRGRLGPSSPPPRARWVQNPRRRRRSSPSVSAPPQSAPGPRGPPHVGRARARGLPVLAAAEPAAAALLLLLPVALRLTVALLELVAAGVVVRLVGGVLLPRVVARLVAGVARLVAGLVARVLAGPVARLVARVLARLARGLVRGLLLRLLLVLAGLLLLVLLTLGALLVVLGARAGRD